MSLGQKRPPYGVFGSSFAILSYDGNSHMLLPPPSGLRSVKGSTERLRCKEVTSQSLREVGDWQ